MPINKEGGYRKVSAFFCKIAAAVFLGACYVSPLAVAEIPVERDSSRYTAPVYQAAGQRDGAGNGVNVASTANNANTSSAPIDSAPQDRLWELFNQLEQMQNEVRQLRGLLETQTYQIDNLKRQQRERYIDLDQRLMELENPAVASEASRPGSAFTNSSAAGSSATKASLVNSSAPAVSTSSDQPLPRAEQKAQYQKAKSFVIGRDWVNAEAALKEVIALKPEGIYKPYAHYWLGLVYLAMPKVESEQAKKNFEVVTGRYPEHPKVPDSLYKLAQIYHAQGATDKAKLTLGSVMSKYPDTASSKLAKEYLQQMLKP